SPVRSPPVSGCFRAWERRVGHRASGGKRLPPVPGDEMLEPELVSMPGGFVEMQLPPQGRDALRCRVTAEDPRRRVSGKELRSPEEHQRLGDDGYHRERRARDGKPYDVPHSLADVY